MEVEEIASVVVVLNKCISLLETATVEDTATLEVVIVVLYLGRLPLLKERVGLTVDDAPLSSDFLSAEMDSLLKILLKWTVEDF